MNIDEIKSTALTISDRTDSELPGKLNTFLTLFESRMNRVLTASEFETSIVAAYVSDTNYVYPLPADYGEMRSLKVATTGTSFKSNYSLSNPEFLENARNNKSDLNLYVIKGSLVELSNVISSDQNVEMHYIRNLPALTDLNITNWLSELYPDVYVFGLLLEISTYARDIEGAAAWKARLDEAILEIEDRSKKKRWSGNPLVTRLG